MRTSPLALVTGATGSVGPALVRYLLREGYAVRVLLRSEVEGGKLPAGVQSVRGDITEPGSLRGAVRGADVLFHLAANLHVNNPSAELAGEYERVNVQGTEHLVSAAVEAGVPRFIYFSTINVYGTGKRSLIYTEASLPAPDTLYARTKRQGEQIALEQHPGSTLLRLAAVYGPQMKGNYSLLVRALAKGLTVMVGDGKNRRTLVYVDDVARAAVECARSQEAVGRIYNITDGSIHSFDEVVRSIQRALGRSEGILYVPPRPIRTGLAMLHRLTAMLGMRPRFGPWLVDKLTEDMAVAGERLQNELNFTPAFSLEDGWRAAIRPAE